MKLWAHAINFRYERPQAGRYRQFEQFDLEALGVLDPALDAEVLDVGWRISQELGLEGLTLLLNSIGDREDRKAYVPVLRAHFESNLDAMCADCRGRFDRAPMRLLDCKKDSCKPFQEGAPTIAEHLRSESAAYFDAVKGQLAALEIPFREAPTLVANAFHHRSDALSSVAYAPVGLSVP